MSVQSLIIINVQQFLNKDRSSCKELITLSQALDYKLSEAKSCPLRYIDIFRLNVMPDRINDKYP